MPVAFTLTEAMKADAATGYMRRREPLRLLLRIYLRNPDLPGQGHRAGHRAEQDEDAPGQSRGSPHLREVKE
jgi:hypothetical protein